MTYYDQTAVDLTASVTYKTIASSLKVDLIITKSPARTIKPESLSAIALKAQIAAAILLNASV